MYMLRGICIFEADCYERLWFIHAPYVALPVFYGVWPMHGIAIITHVVFTNQPTTALAVIRQLLAGNKLVWNIPLLFRTYELLYQRLSIFEAEDIFEETKCLKPCTYKDYRFPL